VEKGRSAQHDSVQHKDPSELVWLFASPMTMETAVSGEDKLSLKSAFVSFSH